MSVSQLVECVPNFSEGRDSGIIDAIADSIKTVDGVALLHVDIGYDANRTVMTFAGSPKGVVEAAYQASRTATQLIDMSKQSGNHPRLGAMDVCPLVALEGISTDELNAHVQELGKRIGEDLHIPVYLYEHSSNQDHRKRLEQIRKGGYENFSTKIHEDGWQPDFGPSSFNHQTGATVLGNRDLLLAFNINLNTKDTDIANKIAREIRSSGYQGKKGKFNHLKAIGWYVDEYSCAQVSTNITHYPTTPAHEVYETIKTLATKYGASVTGSELIGLIPLDAVLAAGTYYQPDINDEDALVRSAIVGLGLADKKKFKPKNRILQYVLRENQLIT